MAEKTMIVMSRKRGEMIVMTLFMKMMMLSLVSGSQTQFELFVLQTGSADSDQNAFMMLLLSLSPFSAYTSKRTFFSCSF